MNLETKTKKQEDCTLGHGLVLHSGVKHTLGNVFVPGYDTHISIKDNACVHVRSIAFIADFMKTASYAYLASYLIS